MYNSQNFDGVAPAPTAPENNLSRTPAPGSPEFDAYVAAEERERNRYGSGINAQRIATLSEDARQAQETRERFGTA
jgi:hypothetical protein